MSKFDNLLAIIRIIMRLIVPLVSMYRYPLICRLLLVSPDGIHRDREGFISYRLTLHICSWGKGWRDGVDNDLWYLYDVLEALLNSINYWKCSRIVPVSHLIGCLVWRHYLSKRERLGLVQRYHDLLVNAFTALCLMMHVSRFQLPFRFFIIYKLNLLHLGPAPAI